MVTVYSENDSLQTKSVGEIVAQQMVDNSPQFSYEEIDKEIQENLKAFEGIDWTCCRGE